MSSPRRFINPLWLCRLSYVVWSLHAERIFSYKLSSLGFVAKQGWQYLRRAHHYRSGFHAWRVILYPVFCILYLVTVSPTPIRIFLPADSFSKYKTKVILNKLCIMRLYTIKYCIFRVIWHIFSRNFTSYVIDNFLLKMSQMTQNIRYLIMQSLIMHTLFGITLVLQLGFL